MALHTLIVAKYPKTHETAVSFLNRRGWNTQVISDLSESIAILSSERPAILFLSLDLNHPSLSKIATFIEDKFQLKVVWFSESQEESVAIKSRQSECRLYGVPSGPNFERFILSHAASSNRDGDELLRRMGVNTSTPDESTKLILAFSELGEDDVGRKHLGLHTALKGALEKVGKLKDIQNSPAKSVSKSVYAIPVEDRGVVGYLTVSTEGLDEESKSKLLSEIDQTIRKTMGASDGFEIKTVIEKAPSFSMATELNGRTHTIEFIETERRLPKLVQVKNKPMLKVPLEEIPTNYPLNFKAYIHMEKNNNFFLYVKSGRHLLPEQKQRLLNNDVKNLSIKEIEEMNFKRFLASSHIQEASKKSKKAS